MKQFEKDLDRLGRAGQLAWGQLKKSKDWNLWLVVGEAMSTGRTMAMKGAGTNKPEGRGYNELFSQWLNRYKLNEIDKVTRSHLLLVMENKIEIEEYRATLTLTERMRLNHPSTMLRHWRKATQVPKPKSAKPNSVEEELATCQDELAAAQAHARELEAAREDAKPTTLAAARELYRSHLKRLDPAAIRAELDGLADELLESRKPVSSL